MCQCCSNIQESDIGKAFLIPAYLNNVMQLSLIQTPTVISHPRLSVVLSSGVSSGNLKLLYSWTPKGYEVYPWNASCDGLIMILNLQ